MTPPSNTFSHLEIHEPADSSDPSEHPIKTKSTPTQEKRTVTFELEDLEAEVNFGIWCLLSDLRDLRSKVRALWKDYSDSKISFSAATTTMIMAIHLARFAEHEFLFATESLIQSTLFLPIWNFKLLASAMMFGCAHPITRITRLCSHTAPASIYPTMLLLTCSVLEPGLRLSLFNIL